MKTIAARITYPNYFVGFRNKHTISPFLKKTFDEIWEAEPELLADTSHSRFRAMSNVNQWLALWWQVASGEFVPARVDNVANIITNDTIDQICEIITGQKHDMFCLNDPDWEVNFTQLAPRIQEAFETILPNKCSFEI